MSDQVAHLVFHDSKGCLFKAYSLEGTLLICVCYVGLQPF